MTQKKPSYLEQVAAIRERRQAERRKYVLTDAYRREIYANRLLSVLIFVVGLPFIGISYLVASVFNLSHYATSTVATFAAIVIAVLLSEKIANKKIGEKNDL